MKYSFERYEKYKDKNGNINAIFVAVRIDDEMGNSLIQEYWLTQEEIDLVLQDENNLIPILEKVVAEGTIKLQEEVANRPQSPEIANETKRKALFSKLTIENINQKINELKQEETI